MAIKGGQRLQMRYFKALSLNYFITRRYAFIRYSFPNERQNIALATAY